VDKTTLVGLQATLLAYLEGKATEEIPVWRMIDTPVEVLARRSRKWQRALKEAGTPLSVVAAESTVGGGSLPGQTLPTRALALEVPSPDALAARLRAADPPVVARIEDDRLLIDPRTVLPEQDTALIETIRDALASSFAES
jgi:L-seryl-tRNA(Ser) seleniumtransferase